MADDTQEPEKQPAPSEPFPEEKAPAEKPDPLRLRPAHGTPPIISLRRDTQPMPEILKPPSAGKEPLAISTQNTEKQPPPPLFKPPVATTTTSALPPTPAREVRSVFKTVPAKSAAAAPPTIRMEIPLPGEQTREKKPGGVQMKPVGKKMPPLGPTLPKKIASLPPPPSFRTAEANKIEDPAPLPPAPAVSAPPPPPLEARKLDAPPSIDPAPAVIPPSPAEAKKPDAAAPHISGSPVSGISPALPVSTPSIPVPPPLSPPPVPLETRKLDVPLSVVPEPPAPATSPAPPPLSSIEAKKPDAAGPVVSGSSAPGISVPPSVPVDAKKPEAAIPSASEPPASTVGEAKKLEMPVSPVFKPVALVPPLPVPPLPPVEAKKPETPVSTPVKSLAPVSPSAAVSPASRFQPPPPKATPPPLPPPLPAAPAAKSAPVPEKAVPPLPEPATKSSAPSAAPLEEKKPEEKKETEKDKEDKGGIRFPKFQKLDKKPAPLLSRRKGEEKGKESAPPTGAAAAKAPEETPEAQAGKTALPAETGTKKGEARPQQPETRKISLPPFLNKRPAPLLSRKKEAGKDPASSKEPPVVVRPRMASWSGFHPSSRGKKILFGVLFVVLISGLGIGTYYLFRQTRVAGTIQAEGFEVHPEIMVIRDFRSDALALKDELASVREPLLEQIKEKDEYARRTQSDLAGREERLRLLEQEIGTTEKDMENLVSEAQKNARKIWETEGVALDNEFDNALQDFSKILQDRAKSLKLNYVHNEEYKSPEVWVNAFRLALYDAPKGVSTGLEREWAEKNLAEWRGFEAGINTRRQALKAKADKFRGEVGPNIEKYTDRIAELRIRVAETEAEIGPLREELAMHQRDLDAVKASEAALDGPYYEQMLRIPLGNVLHKLPLDKNGKFLWTHLEKNPAYPPGNYLFWARAKRNGEEHWAVIPFTIQAYTLSEVLVYDGMFVPVRKYLRD
jgi:hypothetical protein